MTVLVRLVYASTATFAASASGGVELEVGRILTVSRRNNRERDIGGMLHYGNGYFFQALEGPRDAVNETYSRISTDPRHEDVHILSVRNVEERLFEDWTMKYLPSQSDIRALLDSRGLQFNPYLFDEAFSEQFLRACIRAQDPTIGEDEAAMRPGRHKKLSWWRSLWARKRA